MQNLTPLDDFHLKFLKTKCVSMLELCGIQGLNRNIRVEIAAIDTVILQKVIPVNVGTVGT